jgi:hypothetical protein
VAHMALPPGAARRRVLFGLLDADGWTWAGLKATFWFLLIVFLLGVIPNTAYYFTVSRTVDVGYNAVPIVNWCPAENEGVPCPAPAGTVLPWQTSPDELALPGGRSGATVFQSGTHLYLIGGVTPDGPTAETLTTDATTGGNFGVWAEAPALPEPRSDAALAVFVGVPYVIGGLDASGQPTDTVFVGQVEEGRLTGWVRADGSERTPNLTLPHPVAGAGAVATSTGLLVAGGISTGGTADAVFFSSVGETLPPALGEWEQLGQIPLPEPLAYLSMVAIGDMVYVAGGEGPDGPATSVYRLETQDGAPATVEEADVPRGWAIAPDERRLPGARSRAASFTANGALYVIGGVDESGVPQVSNLWTVPDATTGDLPAWQETEETNLPEPRALAPVAAVGSTAFIFGGQGTEGPLDTTVRAGLSPQPPFFRLGLFGATIPGLAIEGEIGQQLGYMNAMGVGMTNFVILVLIGIAYSHPVQTKRFIAWLSRGRLQAPREDA